MIEIVSFVPLAAIESNQLDLAMLENNLARLNAEQTVLLCIKLNLLTSNLLGSTSKQLQLKALEVLVNDQILERKTANDILGYMVNRERENMSSLAFNRASLLETIRWSSIYSKNTRKVDWSIFPHLRNTFVRCILACADLYGKREIEPTLKTDVSREENESTFLLGARRGAVWGASGSDALLALGRTDLLLGDHFLNQFPECKSAFETIYQMTIEEWLTCNAAIILASLDPPNKARFIDTLHEAYEVQINSLFENVPELKIVFERYMNVVAQTLDQLRSGFGDCSLAGDQKFVFRHMRSRPILQFEDNKAIVIDRRLFAENMLAGPLFSIASKMKNETVFQAFGEAFQNYAFQLLDAANKGQRDENRCPFLLNEPKADPMPLNDILIGTEEICGLIEAKGVWLNDQLLSDNDTEKFRSAVLKKYGQAGGKLESGQKTKAKGLGQLASVVKGIANNELKVSREAEFIYSVPEFIPILIVNDPLMTDPLMGKTMAKEFAALLNAEASPTGILSIGKLKVHNVIILSYFDLEFLDAIELECSIIKALQVYSNKWPDRMYSFGKFLHNKQIEFKVRPADEQLVTGRAIAVIDQIASRYFRS